MTPPLDHAALRSICRAAMQPHDERKHVSRTGTAWDVCFACSFLARFRDAASPDVVLALLDEHDRLAEKLAALQPGTAERYVAAMFAEAEKRGMSPFSAKHALTFLVEQLARLEGALEAIAREFDAGERSMLADSNLPSPILADMCQRIAAIVRTRLDAARRGRGEDTP